MVKGYGSQGPVRGQKPDNMVLRIKEVVLLKFIYK